ncbi:MAG: ribose-phosphate pyrophosphokinase [Eubacterium sp.]|nr:ribose-phosphate pyrophosphokinase [Eubacterium sp.]
MAKKYVESIPVGSLAIVALSGSKALGNEVDMYIKEWRKERLEAKESPITFKGYNKDTYLLDYSNPRFGTGESKCTLESSVRGTDLYIIDDVTNYSVEYTVAGHTNHLSPDDHFADIKRVIAAAAGKPKRITVIMPFLYESRQHRRLARESMDCAVMLQELADMGVDNILTFDAHDPRVNNAIPLTGFESIMPTYQFIKYLLRNVDDLTIDADHLMVISPDEGAMGRVVYFANVLGINMGMFYKRRDYTQVIDGRNPIVAHEYLGESVEGKDVLIIDDMISSGDSMLDVARQLKKRKARRVFVAVTFGIFTNGLDKFDAAYEDGTIYRLLSTNCIYQSPELKSREWYINVDVSKFTATFIDRLNHDSSISDLLNPVEKINKVVDEYVNK